MDGQSYWIQHHIPGDMKTAGQLIIDAQPPHEEEIMANGGDYLVDDECEEGATEADDIDQIAAENLIFMARDGQMVSEIIAAGTDDQGAVVVSASDGTSIDCAAMMQQVVDMSSLTHQQEDTGGGVDVTCYTEDYSENTPQMVTEEVITDDWVQHQGEERVEIPAEQIIGSSSQVLLDIEVPLPTVQDEYTALRPYPCDFCSRRFRKKASLMNHMVAHQSDRPHLCKLCGSRFFRRSDLINHLKAHAEAPDPEFDDADFINFVEQDDQPQRHVANDHYYDQDWNIQNPEPIPAAKSSRKQHNNHQHQQQNRNIIASGNSSSTSSSATAARGRISRLRPKEENYTINESLQQEHHEQQQFHQNQHSGQQRLHSTDMEYGECQELQASTAAVKLTQDHSPAIHQQHYPVIDDSKPFVCQQCGLAFAREKALLSHAKNHRNDSPHECNQCNEMFWDTASLQEHLKTHQFEESNSEYDPAEAEDTQSESESEHLYGEFYCSECGMSFHRQDLLRRHAKVHLKTEVIDGGHHGEVILNKDQHCCNTCGENFAEALDLLAHAEIHARYPPFKCVLCGESFFEEHTIKRHLQSIHAQEMTANSCILCGKECRDRKALIKHAWDHSREKCHSCSKCGKNFHNKARLKRHMASHRDKSVICDVCHEEFPDGRSLSNHRHSHSATSSGKLFPCHECGKTFGSRSSQQIHVRIHTGERPYGCRFCWKAFADGGTLRKHERIHTGEKPYACSVCPRAFNQRVVLREHIRSHHSGLDAKRGTYYCTVCSDEMESSGDLIQHLIQHSDRNTAMQRQPISGPRKYKRRRKLKPHEIERLRNESKQNGHGSDIDLSDFDMENVDDLLGISETTQTTTAANNNCATTTTANAKRNKKRTTKAKHNNNHHMTTAGGSSTEEDEDQDDDEQEEDDGEEARESKDGIRQTKNHYNSTSSHTDKLWHTKLIHSNTNEESLLSNLENTLQSIDTLVVSNNNNNSARVEQRKPKYESTAQRTQQVQIIKMETKYAPEVPSVSSGKSRKRAEKVPKVVAAPRPRMIHTEKWRASNSDGHKRRSKTYVTRTEPNVSSANLDLLPKSSTTIVDDYEIISPAMQPPNQISSSPLHIKQEHEQLHLQQHHLNHHHHQQQQQQQAQHLLHMPNSSAATRNSELYDAQLQLEASVLQKHVYEKYDPSIVHDLEEILRSPIKSDKSERHRFTSESSTQFLGDTQSEEEQHMIKIEPISPDLRDIVPGASSSERRSMRPIRSSRVVTTNRKYLEFETDHSSVTTNSQHQQSKRQTASANKSKAARNHKRNIVTTVHVPTSSPANSAYLDYAVNSFSSPVEQNSHAAAAAVASSFSSISAVVSAADATAAAAAAAPLANERKQRFFECEMCSAVFPDRAQLLDHVPIHI